MEETDWKTTKHMGHTVTVKETLYEDVDYILLAQDGVHLRDFVGTIIFGFQRRREIR
jgi:hypothetical protein